MPIKKTISQTQILARAIILFKDIDCVKKWMRKRNRLLQGQKPLDLMDTPDGRETVLIIMEQFESEKPS